MSKRLPFAIFALVVVAALSAPEASEDAKFYGKQLPSVLEIFQRA